MLEGLNFFAEDGLREQRTKRVVVGEPEHVHARGPARCFPSARLAVAGVPIALISEVTAAAELADIVDQRSGIADAKTAAAVDAGHRIARTLLVGALAVI